MRTAAAVPNRIGAVFLPWRGLVTNERGQSSPADSKMKADFLIAIAENDDKREPETKLCFETHSTNTLWKQRLRSTRRDAWLVCFRFSSLQSRSS